MGPICSTQAGTPPLSIQVDPHPLLEQVGSIKPLLEAAFTLGDTNLLKIENLHDFETDHACLRCETKKQYKDACDFFTLSKENPVGILLIESMIGGRPISTFKLTTPITFSIIKSTKEGNNTENNNKVQKKEIRIIEVPYPKEGIDYKFGWEHFEFVVGKHYSSLKEFKEKYDGKIAFNLRAFEKKVNADVSLNVMKNTAFSVKFHMEALDKVIEDEIRDNLATPVPAGYFDGESEQKKE